MANSKNLAGMRFGKLTVVSLDPEPYVSPSGKKTRRWKCKCDCGNEVSVLTNQLTAGKAKSCGCLRTESNHAVSVKDMVGQRFGRLTVVGNVSLEKPESNRTRNAWRCICDCGNEVVKTRKALLSGKVLSCGCLLSETARESVDARVGHYSGTTVSAIHPNRTANKNSKTGVKGVYWSSREKCYIAKIGFRKKTITLGRFENLEGAKKARILAEEKYFSGVLEEYEESKKEDRNAENQ